MQQTISLVPVEEIHILNPRVRNQTVAEEIRKNIREIGLKRPITVTPRKKTENGKKYDLVCGQGRLEAFIAAGAEEIPAIILKVSKEDAHIMSLVENIARRNSSALELLQSIKYLKGKGYTTEAIATKTNLGKDYIRGILRLLEHGEEYLASAVERGRIPLYRALLIASEDDVTVQKALTEACESGALTGKNLIQALKVIDRRKKYGKGISVSTRKNSSISAEDIIATYEREVKKKKQLLAKSDYIKNCMTYVTAALTQLLGDLNFTNQLKAAGMHDMPQHVINILKR